MDVVDKATRSRMMSGIRGKDTKPELLVRKALHARGLRYRLHDDALPGKPDMAFPKFHAVVFIHGCYWHGHDCHLFRLPSSNTEFWSGKIARNRLRDEENVRLLAGSGWRVLTVWECALRGKERVDDFPSVIDGICRWLVASDAPSLEIRGPADARSPSG